MHFYNCKSIKVVIFSKSCKSIGVRAFQNCISLQKAIIPNSVEEICDYAFCGCNALNKVIIPSSLKSAGKGINKSCNSLKQKPILPKNAENRPKNPKVKLRIHAFSEESFQDSDDD